MKILKLTSALIAAGFFFGATPVAHAQIATNVQLSTTENAVYDVTGINEFDWQSSGDLVIEDLLTAGNAIVGGAVTGITSFADWVVAANLDGLANGFGTSTVTYNLYGQARLNDMLDVDGGGIAPATLDTNGTTGGDAGFEITAAFSGIESATMIALNTLRFDTISGSYTFFFDTSPDSVVSSGAGFLDGIAFLTGLLLDVSGTAEFAADGTFSASTLLTNSITGYDPNYIEADPLSNKPLVGTTFDTLVSLPGAQQAIITNGGSIGLDPYTLLAADLRFKADANSEFAANPVPEPGTLALLSLGLLGVAFGSTRKPRATKG